MMRRTSDEQDAFGIISLLDTEMLDFVFIAVAEVIKAKAVPFGVYDRTELCL